MQHGLLTLGRVRLLVTRPDTNAYGNAALNMATSFHLATHFHALLYVAPMDPTRLTALTTLECGGVRRLKASPSRTAMIRVLCRATAAAGRLGLPWARAVGTLTELGRGRRGAARVRMYLDLDVRRAYATRPLEVRLPRQSEQDCHRRLQELGLAPDARVVTLHVRESGYKASVGQVDRDKDVARNARIETYLEAIDWLVARGYAVVRFGDSSATPLQLPGVIDLATSPLRTPEAEIWCVLRSRFFIASDSGPLNLSVLTGVPCLAVNITHPIGAYPLRGHDRYILKHTIDAETGQELTLAEMLTPEHIMDRWAPGRTVFRDNTPAEIREAVEEIEAAVNDGRSPGPAQRAFRERVCAFLDTEYGRKKQKLDRQAGFYLGDGWIGEEFARRGLAVPARG